MESFYGGAIPIGPQYSDGPYTLGQIFSPTTAGSITGIQFYRTAGMGMLHTGALYDMFGNKLAQVSFVNVTTGWMQATFSNPIQINANTQYVMAVVFPDGVYLQQDGFNGLTNQDLVMGTGSGIWISGSSLAFPTAGHQNLSFAIDVMFEPGNPPPPPIPLASTASAQSKAYNRLDSGTIDAVSAAILRAIANGRFAAHVWYLWSDDEAQSISDALTTFGYEVSFSQWSDGTFQMTIRWPHK